jgi:hypothetical protein
MWETERFIVANGFTQFNDQNVGRDLSPYDFFDGEISGNDLEFSDARGRRRKKRKSLSPRAKERMKSREKRRGDKLALKNKEIDTQKQIVEASLKAGEKENQLLSQLGLSNNDSLPPISSEKPKSNKVIFIVGGVVIAGILGYVLYKKFKK